VSQNGVWKANRIYSGENKVCYQDWRSAGCGVRGRQGECWWWWKSAECILRGANSGQEVPMAIENKISSGAAHPCWAELKGVEVGESGMKQRCIWSRWSRDWGVPIVEEHHQQKLHYKALNEISKCQSWLTCTYGDEGMPIIMDENDWGGREAFEAAPPWVIDECNCFCSNTIYHGRRVKLTLKFTLRKHNWNIYSSGILRQRTINSSVHNH